MNPASLLAFTAGAWWLCSIAILLLSSTAALLHPLRRHGTLEKELPRLSAIVPVRDLHHGFAAAQRSLFSQTYDGLELLVAATETDSPALSTVRAMKDSPVPRIVVSDCKAAASPKLNNLWPAICQAGNDIILTKDSNVVLHPCDLARFVECLGSDVGLVSAIPIARELQTFSAWIEASIINGYHARVLMLGDALGLGFGLGKVMLFRRNDLVRAGGFDCLKWAVGEDMALARAMRTLGLRTVLADPTCDQVLGKRSFMEFWQRQLRWMTIWRVQLPAVFVVDLLGSALPTAFAGALAAHLVGVSAAVVFATTLVGWGAIELILSTARGWPISSYSPFAFVARELLTPVLWFRALMSNEVRWAGVTCRVRAKSSPDAEFSPQSEIMLRGRAE